MHKEFNSKQDVYIDDISDEGVLANSKKTYLTNAEMAIRICEIYFTIVPNPGSKTDLKSMHRAAVS